MSPTRIITVAAAIALMVVVWLLLASFDTGLPWLVLGVLVLFYAVFKAGEYFGSPVYTINGNMPPATDWGQVHQVAEIVVTAEVVGYLEPVTAFTVLPELPAAPDPVLLDAAQVAVDEHDELVAKLAAETRSKRTAWTKTRVATARVAGLVDAALRPRRLSRAALVAATIEVDSVARPLVPAPIAKKLEETS